MTLDRNEEYAKFVEAKPHNEIVPTSEKELLQRRLSNTKTVEANNNINAPTSGKQAILNQIISTCAVLLLSAACGMPIGYSAVLLPQLYNSTSSVAIDFEMGSWIASVHSLATPLGSLVSGPCADQFGRRTTLLFSVIPILLGWCLMALSHSYHMILIGRFITGCAVGILGAPAQIYIAETAEPNLRSLLIGAPFFSYSIGILFVYVLGSNLHWRTVAWLGNILPIISAIALFLIPESPAWLARNNHPDKALKALNFLRNNEIIAQKELNTLHERMEQEKVTSKTNENIFKLCCERVAIKPLCIVIIFSILQMMSGTFLVVFYAIDIFSDLGSNIDSKKAAVLTSAVRTICTLGICFILLVIRRRLLTTLSAVGSGLSCLIMSLFMYYRQGTESTSLDVYVAVTCLTCYIAFNTPMMVMPGIMVGELFPAKIRGRTAGAIFAACNLSLFCLAKAFPVIKEAVKTRGIFLIFAIASLMAAVFTYLLQPETKGRSLDQIEDYFNEKNWFWYNRSDKFRSDSSNVEKA